MVGVVGTGLGLLAQYRHALARIVDGIGRGIKVGTVEHKLGTRLVLRQLTGTALVAHVEPDAVVLGPLERHVVFTRTGEMSLEG